MWQGALLGLLGAASWSCANVAIKGVSERLGVWPALLWAQLIGGALVSLVALVTVGVPPGLSLALCGWIGLAGASAAVAYAGLFTALRRGRVAVVTPLISSWAVLSVAIGVVWLGERVSLGLGCGVVAVIAGNALLTWGSGTPGSESAASGKRAERGALGWALAAACGFGVMMPAVNTVGEQLGRLWTVPLVWAAELALVIPFMAWRGELRRVPQSRQEWWITSRAALFEVAGFVAVSFALGLAPVAVVSPLASLATAGSVLLGLILLRERPGKLALLGAALASLGVVLVNLR